MMGPNESQAEERERLDQLWCQPEEMLASWKDVSHNSDKHVIDTCISPGFGLIFSIKRQQCCRKGLNQPVVFLSLVWQSVSKSIFLYQSVS